MNNRSYKQVSPPAVPSAESADVCDVFVADAAKVAGVRSALMTVDEVSALAETFKLLGDPTRVRLIDALSHAELCVCDLATLLELTESAVSHQLRLLRGMRLARARREGRLVFYSLDDQHVIGLFQQGLRHIEETRTTAPAAGRPGEATR